LKKGNMVQNIKDEQIFSKVLNRLNERVKELNCLYQLEEIFKTEESTLDTSLQGLVEVIPTGWQHTTLCEVRISYKDLVIVSDDFLETEWKQQANIVIDENVEGKIEVFYLHNINSDGSNPFYAEEQKLLNTIARRLGEHIFSRRLKDTIAFINAPESGIEASEGDDLLPISSNQHWKWRYKMAEVIAEKMDFDRFGVEGVYIIGSTKNAEAGPASDIDLLIHISDESDPEGLSAWIEGWSLCLSEMNFNRTGHYVSDGLIDLHLITAEDIKNKDSFAIKIGAVTDGARPLKLRGGK